MLLSNYFKSSSVPKSVADTESKERTIKWNVYEYNHLSLKYCKLFSNQEATSLFNKLEDEIEYLSSKNSMVKVYGSYYIIPRKQAAYGEENVTYTYSHVTIPAKPWTQTLLEIKKAVEEISSCTYNFVLVNRYADGKDKMGFHQDDEKDLDPNAPIASVSLGAERDFIFKYHDPMLGIANYKMLLQHGSLLLMLNETNKYWQHALPARAKCTVPRINLTFRKIN